MKRYERPSSSCKILEEVDNLPLHADVECAHRFIADDEARLDRQRPRNADALALTAAEFVRVARRHFGLEPDLLKKRGDGIPPVGGRKLSKVDLQRFSDDFAAGHARIKRTVGILKNHLHLPAQWTEFPFSHG